VEYKNGMEIQLDHLIVHARDRVAAARRLAEILGCAWAEQAAIGPFSPVYVSSSLTLDFDQVEEGAAVPLSHYAFRVDEAKFDEILARLQALGIAYRSTPMGPVDHQVNPAFGGRLVYWSEPDGHAWEVLTVSYAREQAP